MRLTAAAAVTTGATGTEAARADPASAAELAGYLATVAFFRGEPARIVQLADEALALAPSTIWPAAPGAATARGVEC